MSKLIVMIDAQFSTKDLISFIPKVGGLTDQLAGVKYSSEAHIQNYNTEVFVAGTQWSAAYFDARRVSGHNCACFRRLSFVGSVSKQNAQWD